MYYSTIFGFPVGLLTMASDGENLVGLWIEGQKYYEGILPEGVMEQGDIPVFERTKNWLKRYFAGEKPEPSELPLAPAGGEFRQGVWEILRSIPYGSVLTYGEIAKMMAAKANKATMSARAVGGAVGHNPISIIIPCHRVVGASGNLIGYAGGIATKVKLLALEGVDMSRFFVPPCGGDKTR